MSRCWTFQDTRAKEKQGAKARWSVGWIDPEIGRQRSKKIGSRSMAEKYARKLEGLISAGLYVNESRKTWADFLEEYKAKIASTMPWGTREGTLIALAHFGRLAKPGRVQGIKRQTIDGYVAARRLEKGTKGRAVSPATVNKELRVVRAVLRIAHDWGYLPTVPKVPMLREPGKLARYVTPEDFARIYGACDKAKRPQSGDYTPGEWWRGVVVFAYMTGWRISEILALRWGDVSLDKGSALTRAEDNKGRRDALVPLHPVVVEHLRKLADASVHSSMVFGWPYHERTLWTDFHGIQEAAGIAPEAVYGFHDYRRAFATMNAPRLTADALQALMRHRSYSTTQRYINMARQLDSAVERLEVPDVLREGG